MIIMKEMKNLNYKHLYKKYKEVLLELQNF